MAREPRHGVSLEQFAGVTAALADAFDLDLVLAQEGLPAATWRAASISWKQALCVDARGSGELFAEYRLHLATAEDVLDRAVRPIGDDLAAWLAFLRAWARHAAPTQILEPAGLRMSDVSRLQRRWDRRLAASPELRAEAARLAPEEVAELPALEADPGELRPFPWSPPSAPARDPDDPPAASSEEGAVSGLDRYVAVHVALERCRPADVEATLALHGLDPASFATFDGTWRRRLAADPALERDFRALCAHARAARIGPAQGAPAEGAPAAAARAAAIAIPESPDPPEPSAPARPPRWTAPVIRVRRTVLPFRGPRPTVRSVVRAPAALQAFAADPTVSSWTAEAAAVPVPAPVPVPVPALTLERHASLAVELAASPERRAEILHRYGLSEDLASALHRQLEDRLRASEELRVRWQEACDAYRAWLARAGGG